MTDERDKMRHVFFTAWLKHRERKPVEPLEAQLIEIILMHPEYHALLDQPENVQLDQFPETNPFLHMSLHLAIREQVSTNRPAGIQAIYQQLVQQVGDVHLVEHQIMEPLAETLWLAQRDGVMPDEKIYLDKLRKLSC